MSRDQVGRVFNLTSYRRTLSETFSTYSFRLTLYSTGWSDCYQTVEHSCFVADGTYIFGGSQEAGETNASLYTTFGVHAVSVGNGIATFKATRRPTSDLVVNVNRVGGGSRDSTPVGTVISFMGYNAPDGYLVCDGAQYAVADYPELAEVFSQEFGSVNHFGGDGTDSFAVPDMRNLFVRGYHGESGSLSGDIGVKQEATQHINLLRDSANNYLLTGTGSSSLSRRTHDTETDTYTSATRVAATEASCGSTPMYYTSRPVNTAVLFCIKY